MDQLNSVLKMWAEKRDIEEFISLNLFADQSALQSELERLPAPLRDSALSTLGEIQSALQTYIVDMDNEKQKVQDQIDANIRSKQACLSYGSSIDIDKKNNDT